MAIKNVWQFDDAELLKDAKKSLRKYFPIGSRVTVVHIRSTESGSTFKVFGYSKTRKEIVNVTDSVARVTGHKIDNVHNGVHVRGNNISRAGVLVYDLSSALYRGSRSPKLEKNREGYALDRDEH